MDVGDEESVVAGFQKTVELWGHVDIMVNCAAPHNANADSVDVMEFDKVHQGKRCV